jgi:hypothetical protein
MSANQEQSHHAVKSAIVTLNLFDDAIFDIKDAFPKLAPIQYMVRINIIDFLCEALLFITAMSICRQKYHCHSHLV